MEIRLPWGKDALGVTVPDTWNVIYPARISPEKKRRDTGVAIVTKAMQNPFGMKPLDSMKLKGKRVVIIVDDNTRPTPAYTFFTLILDSLKKAGADLKNVVLLPGLGIHTAMTEEEMADKVGAKNLKKIKWENHNAFDPTAQHFFGSTMRGTPVYLNKRLASADLIILVGLIEPHLWAGFGGGMKNILPGVASAETIGRHHEIIAEPPYRFNRVGVLPEENSFRQDLEEIRSMILADIFCVNVSLDHTGEITAAFAGDPIRSHRAGVEHNYNELGLALEKQVDGIIVNSYPMDINFKQSMKCVGNSLPALKPGGVVMGFLRAERGLDDIPMPKDAKPLWLVKAILRLIGPSRVRAFLDIAKKGLNVEEKFLIYYSMQLIRQYDLYFHVPTLSAGEVKALGFFENYADPQAVIDRAVRSLGKNATVAVFPQGGATFPVVGGK